MGLGALNKAEFINRGGEDILEAFQPAKTRYASTQYARLSCGSRYCTSSHCAAVLGWGLS